MPHYWAGWAANPHASQHQYDLFKKASSEYKNNILGIYDKSRTDENELIPNTERIKKSVDIYIDNNIIINYNLEKIIKFCDNENTLVIHLRSGDKGIVNDNFVNKINEISVKYSNIVILCGIHQNHIEIRDLFPNVEQSINNMNHSLSKIKSLNNPKIIFDTSEPDIHLSIMRRCKNLLVHRGGFSILAVILFNGYNLYITDEFELANNKDFFFKHKIIATSI